MLAASSDSLKARLLMPGQKFNCPGLSHKLDSNQVYLGPSKVRQMGYKWGQSEPGCHTTCQRCDSLALGFGCPLALRQNPSVMEILIFRAGRCHLRSLTLLRKERLPNLITAWHPNQLKPSQTHTTSRNCQQTTAGAKS